MEPPLLIIWHSRTGASEALAQAAAQGAGEKGRLLGAEDVTPQQMFDARGYLFICPENLGSMSGAMKEMFDRTYYDMLGRIEGRGYATIIAAGSDGEGAQRQIDRIVTGWRLKRVSQHWIVNLGVQEKESILAPKLLADDVVEEAFLLGKGMSEGLSEGIF
jgi:multimeric flavodoxin WrbA